MEYNFKELEQKWQKHWSDNKVYKVEVDNSRPKYYVLDMFPYPSGAGLHVGHPLGYIASDIYSRYKRLGDNQLDENYFPILWRKDGYRTPQIETYLDGPN